MRLGADTWVDSASAEGKLGWERYSEEPQPGFEFRTGKGADDVRVLALNRAGNGRIRCIDPAGRAIWVDE